MILLIGLTNNKSIFALNFYPVPNYIEAYYKVKNDTGNLDIPLISYRIDSIDTLANPNGPTLQIYPNHVVSEISDSSCAYQTNDTSIFGPKVTRVESTDICYFENHEGKTITFRYLASEGLSWNFYEIDSTTYIRAKVDSKRYTHHISLLFNVRYITLHAVDQQGNKVPHDINGTQLQNSFHAGLLETVNFHDFPEDTTVYKVAGLTKGATPPSTFSYNYLNPKTKDFFDFDVGDEFHYKITKKSQDSPMINKTTFEKRMVLNKDTSSSDSLKYDFFRSRFVFDPNAKDSNSTLKIDTISKSYSLSRLSFLDKMVNELILNSPYGDGYMTTRITSKYNRRFVKEPQDHFSYQGSNNCLKDTLKPYPDHIYGNKLGQIYFKDLLDGSSKFDTVEKKLIYFQKGLSTWGEPYNFDKATTIENRDKVDNSIKVYPNPATSRLFVKGDIFESATSNIKIALYDVSGKKIWSDIKSEDSVNKVTIPLDDHKVGIYFLSISTGQNDKKVTRKIIKQ